MKRRPYVVGSRRGAVAVEAAIIGSLFCMLLFGAIEFARYYYTLQAVRTVVAEAARQAQINTSLDGCATGDSINSNVVARTVLNTAGLQVCFSRNTVNSVTTVNVNASYNFSFIAPFISNTVYNLNETTQTAY